MSRRRYKPEQIIRMLREAEVGLSQGMKVRDICRGLEISEQTYYRWRREYGGLKVSQVKQFKELQKENSRLKKAVAELTLDKLILKEALEGNYWAPPAPAMRCLCSGKAWHIRKASMPGYWAAALNPETQSGCQR